MSTYCPDVVNVKAITTFQTNPQFTIPSDFNPTRVLLVIEEPGGAAGDKVAVAFEGPAQQTGGVEANVPFAGVMTVGLATQGILWEGQVLPSKIWLKALGTPASATLNVRLMADNFTL